MELIDILNCTSGIKRTLSLKKWYSSNASLTDNHVNYCVVVKENNKAIYKSENSSKDYLLAIKWVYNHGLAKHIVHKVGAGESTTIVNDLEIN